MRQDMTGMLLMLEDVYASLDVNIVDDVLRAILLWKISEFPSGTQTHKVVGSSPAWELRNFSE